MFECCYILNTGGIEKWDKNFYYDFSLNLISKIFIKIYFKNRRNWGNFYFDNDRKDYY